MNTLFSIIHSQDAGNTIIYCLLLIVLEQVSIDPVFELLYCKQGRYSDNVFKVNSIAMAMKLHRGLTGKTHQISFPKGR